jgi:hypothetical protein
VIVTDLNQACRTLNRGPSQYSVRSMLEWNSIGTVFVLPVQTPFLLLFCLFCGNLLLFPRVVGRGIVYEKVLFQSTVILSSIASCFSSPIVLAFVCHRLSPGLKAAPTTENTMVPDLNRAHRTLNRRPTTFHVRCQLKSLVFTIFGCANRSQVNGDK